MQNESPVPECILQDPVNPLLLFLMKELANGAKVSRNNFMNFNYHLPKWLLNAHLGGLKQGLVV